MSIVLAATPIGNDNDVSVRFREEITRADVIAAEDTRRFLNLAARLGLQPRARLLSYHEHNEAERSSYLVDVARTSRVVMVSDAGMPSVSDPGYRLVRQAYDEGVEVTVVPGPSAVVTAVALSGIASDSFCFDGFIPRKESERETFLRRRLYEERTMVFFESPRRLRDTLASIKSVYGDKREIAVCRELTKTHEEVVRGDCGEVCERFSRGDILGEIVIVLAGVKYTWDESVDVNMVKQVEELVELGLRAKDAARFVAEHNNERVKRVYDAYLLFKREV